MKLISSTVIALTALVFGTYVHAEFYCKDVPPEAECSFGQKNYRQCTRNACRENCPNTGRTEARCCIKDARKQLGDDYCVFS